jgi:hypothetical protein
MQASSSITRKKTFEVEHFLIKTLMSFLQPSDCNDFEAHDDKRHEEAT